MMYVSQHICFIARMLECQPHFKFHGLYLNDIYKLSYQVGIGGMEKDECGFYATPTFVCPVLLSVTWMSWSE